MLLSEYLKPCLHCGSDKVFMVTTDNSYLDGLATGTVDIEKDIPLRGEYYGWCRDCSAESRKCEHLEDAIATWNMRAE